MTYENPGRQMNPGKHCRQQGGLGVDMCTPGNCAVGPCLEFPKRPADAGLLRQGIYSGRTVHSHPFRVLWARYFSPTSNTDRWIDLPSIQPHEHRPE